MEIRPLSETINPSFPPAFLKKLGHVIPHITANVKTIFYPEKLKDILKRPQSWYAFGSTVQVHEDQYNIAKPFQMLQFLLDLNEQYKNIDFIYFASREQFVQCCEHNALQDNPIDPKELQRIFSERLQEEIDFYRFFFELCDVKTEFILDTDVIPTALYNTVMHKVRSYILEHREIFAEKMLACVPKTKIKAKLSPKFDDKPFDIACLDESDFQKIQSLFYYIYGG